MSKIEAVADKLSNVAVGLAATAFTITDGGITMALAGVGALAGIGVGVSAGCSTRAWRRAVLKAAKAYGESSEANLNALDRARAILDRGDVGRIDVKDLREIQLNGTLAEDGAELVVKSLPLDDDPEVAKIIRSCLIAGIESCLSDPEFRDRATFDVVYRFAKQQGLIHDELKEIRKTADEIAAQVDGMTRAELEELATAWQIEDASSFGTLHLKSALLNLAADANRVSEKIASLEGFSNRIDNIRAAAAHAVDRMNLDEARELVRNARQVLQQERLREPLEQDAKLAEQEAEIELLANNTRVAYDLLSAAADSFGAIDPLEPARQRLKSGRLLYDRGLRYGGEGLALAAQMWRAALETLSETDDPTLWAHTQNSLAIALQNLGNRLPGEEGTKLLSEAVTAYRDALRVRTETAHPIDWAMTTQNLAIALQLQGIRLPGGKGAVLLGEAVTAYRDALRVYTEADHSVYWATTTQNLAGALLEQGMRPPGGEGAALLGEAVAAFRDALRLHSEADYPVEWAAATQNLALALQEQGKHLPGKEGVALLGEATTAYCDALRVRTEADRPVEWAETQENMGTLEVSRAEHDSCCDPRLHLEQALAHVEASLTIYNLEHLAYRFGIATKLRDDIKSRLAAL